jgi:phosphoribosylformylglycinamidine synthase
MEPGKHAPLPAGNVPEVEDYGAALLQMLNSPDLSSRRWVYEQYDTLIQGNSLQVPGGDAGVVRVEGHHSKALAFSSDVTPRYCEADPYEGGKQAVAECWRNLTAVGAEPLAATDNLNFGNPERPEIMGQLVKAIGGIGDACRALAFPIVSGNVSLYNETNGQAILPTPTIAGVGLIPDWTKTAKISGMRDGDILILVGGDGTHLGQSIYLRDLHGRADGPAPAVDLNVEKRNGDFIRSAIRNGQVTACHDLSDGGVAIALSEMCMSSGKGAIVEVGEDTPHALLFGEDQARYVVAVAPDTAKLIMLNAEGSGVPFRKLGTVGGSALTIGRHLTISVTDLTQAHESWFPDYMSGQAEDKIQAA